MLSKRVSPSFCVGVLLLVLLLVFNRASPASAAGDDAGSSSPEGYAAYAFPEPADTPHPGGRAAATIASYRIYGTGLHPRKSGLSYVATNGGGCFHLTGGDDMTVWTAPLHLPQGATLIGLRMYYEDTDASTNGMGWLTVYDLYGNMVDEWSVGTVGNTGSGFNDSTAINHIVDYDSYSYALNWRPYVAGSTMVLCGFRVFYTPPAARRTAVVIPIN